MEYKNKYNMLFPARLSSSNILKLYTLYLLRDNQKLYGKEILDIIKNISHESIWTPSHGTLYPLLQEMKALGFIKEETAKGCVKYYSITEKGEDEFNKDKEELKEKIEYSSKFYNNLMNNLYK